MVRSVRATPWRAVTVVSLVWGALAAPVLAAPLAAVNPVLSFADQSVVANGMTPGGRVVWFGVMRELNEGALDWSHLEKITADSGGAGNVQLDLGKPVPPQSLWFAVDLATGHFAAAAPAGYPLRQFEVPGGAIAAASNRLELARRLVIILCVRPGVGAWTLRVGDGGPGDSDGVVDGTIRADLSQLTAVDATPGALQALATKDVVLIVDQDRMDFVAVNLN